MRYAIQQLNMEWQWMMAVDFMTDGRPIAYATKAEAQAALDTFLEDDPEYSPEVFRIVQGGPIIFCAGCRSKMPFYADKCVGCGRFE